MATDTEGNYKNALPSEVASGAAFDTPRELRSIADNDAPLSRAEADVAGISTTPEVVYGDSSEEPNRDDQLDMNEAGPDEHV